MIIIYCYNFVDSLPKKVYFQSKQTMKTFFDITKYSFQWLIIFQMLILKDINNRLCRCIICAFFNINNILNRNTKK